MHAVPCLLSLSRSHIRTRAHTHKTMDTSAVAVFLVETPQDCPGFVTAEVWSNVCDFCKAWASGHIRPCHMVLPPPRPPHCPVCRELWRIKFYHLLSHSPPLINILTSFFPVPVLASKGPIFQTHSSDLFWQLGLFSFTFSWQSSGPTCSTSATADEACICRLPTSHPATCQDIRGSKLRRSDNGLNKECLCL